MRVVLREWRALSRGRDAGSANRRLPPAKRGQHETLHCRRARVSSAPVFAGDGDAGVFDKGLNPDAPECLPVSAFKSVSTATDLTPEQFQFSRALYIAIAPVSRELPPGDHAVMASSGGAVMVALVADGQACARFLAPDFIKTMLMQVGQGVTIAAGMPL